MKPQLYSVYGCWKETRERYAEAYEATSPRAAEDQAKADARETGGTLWVCRVVAGEVPPADMYTAFTDPENPGNLDAEGLEADMPDLMAGDPDWTVFGIAVPHGTADADVWRTGERYGDVVAATSAGAAEDVAGSRLADQGGDLWVCATLAGQVPAVDTYAVFVDPDVRAVPVGTGRQRKTFSGVARLLLTALGKRPGGAGKDN